jgi:hypothetical protein
MSISAMNATRTSRHDYNTFIPMCAGAKTLLLHSVYEVMCKKLYTSMIYTLFPLNKRGFPPIYTKHSTAVMLQIPARTAFMFP